MFISFYDKNFNTINNNSSLNIETYSLSKRSYDLNEFDCVCEPIDLTVEPMFAIIRDNKGKSYYDCLSPIVTKGLDNKSKVIARDLISVFNTECIIDMTVSKTTVKDYLQYIFDSWKNFVSCGFENIELDLSSIDLTDVVLKPVKKDVYNILELFKKILSFYNLYIYGEINIKTKTLKFTIRKSNENIVKIKVEEYGIVDFNKTNPSINLAYVTNNDFSANEKWYLLEDGSITDNSTLQNIFPTITKVFLSENLSESRTNAILELAENRFQETIELKITEKDRIYDIGFNSSIDVFYKGLFYKRLPIGEIKENEKGERAIKLGNLPVDFIQLI